MRGLGDLQVQIMETCEEDEAPRACFSVAAIRERLAEDRGVLRCDRKAFKMSYGRALDGLVRRQHLIWGDKKRSRIRRGAVQPVLPGLTKKEARDFAAFYLREAARPPEKEEDTVDYLTDEPGEVNAMRELQLIAMNSPDFGARLSAIRRLAQYLGATESHRPPITTAKWAVVRVAPGEPDHVDTKPAEEVATDPPPRTDRGRRKAYDESGHTSE